MATFAEIVGDKFPEAATTDSQSFVPVMNCNTGHQVRETLIVNGNRRGLAFRHHNWKLITMKGPGGFTHWDYEQKHVPEGQLYDLARDPTEQNNLWNAKPDLVQKLVSMLEAEIALK